MTKSEVMNVVCAEFLRYKGVTVEDEKIGDKAGFQVKLGSASYALEAHEMLEYQYHLFCRLVVEMLSMHNAKIGVGNAVSSDG